MPGGNGIVYAGMPWLEYRSATGPNIHMVDLKTSQVSDLPGSDNLFSPRCSPDGRYVAALSADFFGLGLLGNKIITELKITFLQKQMKGHK